MNRGERAKEFAKLIARNRDGGLEGIAPATLDDVLALSAQPEVEFAMSEGANNVVIPDPLIEGAVAAANRAIDKISLDREGSDLTPDEVHGLEAIIFPRERPAIDIVGGDFSVNHDQWLDLTQADIRSRLLKAIPSVGRIGLPRQSRIPYAGTGFFVGANLLMTNRHVAEVFAQGLGDAMLHFRPGAAADVDFLQERDRTAREEFAVKAVSMIHPYWDMALLEVEGVAKEPLCLSLADIGELDGRRVAVIGYPAYDPQRNDISVQNQLFSGIYGVKRLQPGELHARRATASFGKTLSAGTHDCSTLGGNSGSAVIDLETGHVLGLHFGGRYRDINYFVPSFELGRDGRVVDTGIVFEPKASGGTPPWSSYWPESVMDENRSDLATDNASSNPVPGNSGRVAVVLGAGNAASITVPLTITVSLEVGAKTSELTAAAFTEGLAEPHHDRDYTSRKGYREDFLPGHVVPLPQAANPAAVARLIDGSDTLKYGNFSVQMHARRRLALFTASNVTGEHNLRRPEPGRDYTRKGLAGLGKNDQEKWFADPRLEARFQLSDRFYTQDNKAFDKGHIVRRDDVAWGASYDLLRQANGDTYHITNCSPQVAPFNQSQRGEDNWGDLENLVLAQAASERYCLFAGPVLRDDDDVFVGKAGDGATLRTRIPSAFWKVVIAAVGDGIAAYAFVLEQDLANVDLEFVPGEAFRRVMVPIAELEQRTGVIFPDNVRAADRFASEDALELAARSGLARSDASRICEAASASCCDDSDAAIELATPRYDAPSEEGPNDYRLAKALEKLRDQVNALAPHRSRASDGWIGDASHQTRASDHNPWVRDGMTGIVTAIDITHDLKGGCDAGKLAEALRAAKDTRIKYVIWNRQIASCVPMNGKPAWAWRPYAGKNPHNHHVHVSVQPDKGLYDSVGPWQISV